MQSNKVARQETMPTSIRQLVIVAYAPSEEHIDSRPNNSDDLRMINKGQKDVMVVS